MAEQRLIKRYANRKLYDTVARRFTTLDELASLVSSGTSILVKDHENGADRTEEILAQVLGVRAKKAKKAATGKASAGSDALTELLRNPSASPLLDLADALSGGVAGGTARRVKGSSTSSKDEMAKDLKKARKRIDRLEEEVVELRDQVSQIVDAVTMLLRERAAELDE